MFFCERIFCPQAKNPLTDKIISLLPQADGPD
jgi:hypothetical protein